MRFLSGSPRLRLAAFALVALSACTPEIGDKCVLSTDCSTRGDRLCDTSQPDGYCTQFNCSKNSCPDNAACVLFNAAIPGCGFDDRAGGYGSRVARAFCVSSCGTDGDCRAGYLCADPRTPPWNGLVQDDVQDKRTCLVIPAGYTADGGVPVIASKAPAPVCSSVGPKVDPIDASAPVISSNDASVTPVDAGAPDADAGDAADAADGD
jgi:hypothetical protein